MCVRESPTTEIVMKKCVTRFIFHETLLIYYVRKATYLPDLIATYTIFLRKLPD